MISVSIVNVTSYTGLELLRLLAQHPHFILTSVTARSTVGKRLDEVFPQLTSRPNVGDKEHISLDPGLVITEEPARTDLAFVSPLCGSCPFVLWSLNVFCSMECGGDSCARRRRDNDSSGAAAKTRCGSRLSC